MQDPVSARGRSASTKKRKLSRSRSRTPSLRISRMSTVAIANPSRGVGMGMSTNTVLRTSFFYNAAAPQGTGIYTGYLKPGSCFDPCGDLANIQPQMFDQFSAMYSRYKVNSAVVRIKITGVSGPSVWVAAAYPSVDATALATYQAAASQQFAKTTSGGFQVSANEGTGTEGKYLSFKLKHDSIVGAKSDTWDIGAPVGSDPTATQFMVLPMFIQAATAAIASWVLEVDIWQNVTFSQKKNTVDA